MRVFIRGSFCLLVTLAINGCLVEQNNTKAKFDNQRGEQDSPDSNSLYFKYRFSHKLRNVELFVKVDREHSGKLTTLHINDPRDSKLPIYSISLKKSDSLEKGEYSYIGHTSIGEGMYTVTSDKHGNPLRLRFLSYQREEYQREENDTSVWVDVAWYGEKIDELSNRQWQRMEANKPPSPSFDEPKRLPKREKNWLEEMMHFYKKHKSRVVAIGGRNYYGVVYEMPSGRCSQLVWGLDDVKVVKFLSDLNLRIRKDYLNQYKPTLYCKGDGNITFSCEDSRVLDEGVFRVEGKNLIFESRDGTAVYIDENGECGSGFPRR